MGDDYGVEIIYPLHRSQFIEVQEWIVRPEIGHDYPIWWYWTTITPPVVPMREEVTDGSD